MGNTKSKKTTAFEDIFEGLEQVRGEHNEIELLSKLTYFDVKMINQLQIVFERISKSSVDDQKIDPDEFAQALGLSRASMLNRRLFDRFNVTRSSQMNFREFAMALSVLSPRASLEDKIRFTFDLYDANKDGNIDTSELKEMLVSALENPQNEIKLSSEVIDLVCENTIQQLDIDGNGKIDFHEYSAMVRKHPRVLDAFTLDLDAMLGRSNSSDSSDDSEEDGSPVAFKTRRSQTLTRMDSKRSKSAHAKIVRSRTTQKFPKMRNPFKPAKRVKAVVVEDLDAILG